MIERIEGDPFFLEEAIRSLAEIGMPVGERGTYNATRAADAIRVPPTVQMVLATRIDRLSLSDKRLLQTASVVGKDVPLTILQSVAEVCQLPAVAARPTGARLPVRIGVEALPAPQPHQHPNRLPSRSPSSRASFIGL